MFFSLNRFKHWAFIIEVLITGKVRVDGSNLKLSIPLGNRLQTVALQRYKKLMRKEPDTINWIKELAYESNAANDSVCFIDIGANVGTISFHAASRFKHHPTIVMCEANPSNLSFAAGLFIQNFKTADLFLACGFLKNGISFEKIPNDFFGAAGTTIGSADDRSIATKKQGVHVCPIDTRTLGALLESHPNKKCYLKIDVDGAELDVINELSSEFLSNFQSVMIEVDIFDTKSTNAIIKICKSANLLLSPVSETIFHMVKNGKVSNNYNKLTLKERQTFDYQKQRMLSGSGPNHTIQDAQQRSSINIFFNKRNENKTTIKKSRA